jgi:MFS transporter, DHA1 family, multidrug resistance protein
MLALGATAALGAAAIDMYLPSLPTIQAEFADGSAHAQFTLSAFFIGLGLGQLCYGPVSDALGRRRVLYFGTVIYIAASIACVMSSTIEELILFRFLQALGAAAGGVVSRAIVRDLYSLNEASRAQSIINMVFLITPLLAPNVGGYMLEWYGWRAIFMVLCAFGTLCLVLLYFKIPETLPAERRRPLRPGHVLRGYAQVLSNRRSVGCIISGGTAFTCMFAYFAGTPFIFIDLYEVPARHYGLLFGLNVLGVMSANYLNVRLVTRFGAITMLRYGVTIIALGSLLLLATVSFDIGGILGIIIPLFIVIGSLGLVGANAIAGALEPFPDLAGTAAALSGAFNMLLGASAGIVIGLMHDGTALPMAQVIATFGLLSFGSYALLVARPN